jgi:predicted ATPase/Tfp pilus assembly protein PilF
MPQSEPAQSVTLVFTDIEGSTVLWEHLGEDFLTLLEVHNQVIRESIASHQGYEVKTDGDSFMIAFTEPRDAVLFCLEAQHRLHDADWPSSLLSPDVMALAGHTSDDAFHGLRVRMGVHTGRPLQRRDPTTGRSDFFGADVNRAARLSSAGHGGQLLVSDATWSALDPLDLVVVEDLGEHALRGLESRERVRQLLPPKLSSRRFPRLKTPELRKTNLPARVDSFIGREDALAELTERVEKRQRLITILGAGGLGKTRLSQRFGAEQLSRFPGGVWFCDLTEARNLDGFVHAVGHALRCPLKSEDPAKELGHTLAQRGHLLLILDNFEQVVDTATKTLGSWILDAPNAVFLVTSRIRLNLTGEHLFSLVPHCTQEAMKLFEERAQAVCPGFALTQDNRSAVKELVERLDGIALAIELAAARVQLIQPAQILARLGQRFQLLRGRRRDRNARQATLRSAIDWSWELLDPWEKQALAQCSVFRGGFSLEAAEAVLELGDCPELVMDVVESLVDHSLLRTHESAMGEMRLGMFESIQAYAAEKLAEAEPSGAEAPAIQFRHAQHYSALGSDTHLDSLFAHGGVNRQRALAIELENLLQAVTTAMEQEEPGLAAHCALAGAFIFQHIGPTRDSLSILNRVLEGASLPPELQARLDWRKSQVLRRLGQREEALALMERSHQEFRALDDRRSAWRVLGGIAILRLNMGDPDRAGICYQAALVGHREEGDRRYEGQVLANLANYYLRTDQVERAVQAFEAAITIHREVGNRVFEGSALGNLGCMQHGQGLVLAARESFEAALAIHREVGNRLFEGIELGNLGGLLHEQGERDAARDPLRDAIEILDELWPVRAAENRGRLAVLLAQEGRLDEAQTLIEQAEAHVRPSHPQNLGRLLCCKGLIAYESGNPEGAQAALKEASEIAAKLRLGQETELRQKIETLKQALGSAD